jgi:hypothetical protein
MCARREERGEELARGDRANLTFQQVVVQHRVQVRSVGSNMESMPTMRRGVPEELQDLSARVGHRREYQQTGRARLLASMA